MNHPTTLAFVLACTAAWLLLCVWAVGEAVARAICRRYYLGRRT